MSSTAPGLELGPAHDAELDAIAALSDSAISDGPGAASLARERASRGGRLFVARRCGRVLAFVSAQRAADRLEISWLAVDEGERRRGLGRRLLEALIASEQACGGGLGALQLDVRAGDTRAGGFYAAAGFVAVGRRARYYRDGEDAILMTRNL